MKLFHLVVSFSASLFLYLALGIVWGSAGTTEFTELQAYRDRLITSVSALHDNQMQLQDDLERILRDPGRLQQEAHAIGMIGPNEIKVRIPVPLPGPTEQKNIMATKPEAKIPPKALLTGIAVSFGLILLYFLTLFDFEASLSGNHRRTKRRTTSWYQGIRVQTASRE